MFFITAICIHSDVLQIYLRNLASVACRSPSSSTFGRASASFTSGPWVHSYSQLQAVALSSSTTLPDTHATQFPTKEPWKQPPRYLFSEGEIEILTRNAEELLLLHEQFVRELRALLEPLGFPMDQLESDKIGEQQKDIKTLDAAIRAVSTKFATEVCAISYRTYGMMLKVSISRQDSAHISPFVRVIPKPWILLEKQCNNTLLNGIFTSSIVALLSLRCSIRPRRQTSQSKLP